MEAKDRMYTTKNNGHSLTVWHTSHFFAFLSNVYDIIHAIESSFSYKAPTHYEY